MNIRFNNLIYICYPHLKFYDLHQRHIFFMSLILPVQIMLIGGIVFLLIFTSYYYSNEEIISKDKLNFYIDNIKKCQINNTWIIDSYEIENEKYCLFSINDVKVNIDTFDTVIPIINCINETYIKDNMMKHINSFNCDELKVNFNFGIIFLAIYFLWMITSIIISYRSYRSTVEFREYISEIRRRAVERLYYLRNQEINEEINEEINREITDEIIMVKIQTSNETCSICFENISEEIYCIECKHEYHIECLELWLKRSNTCPLCRTVVKFIYVDNA